MDNSIIFPLSVFPMPIRNIVDSLHKYENYQIDFTASAFLTVFAATMGNTWSARFMTGWVSRPIIYMVLVGPPSCGKTPPLRQAIAPLLMSQPYCSIIGSTQPGMLSTLFGGKRSLNGFSSRFLKVYPYISAMPFWNETSMPEDVLEEWEHIIRKVDGIKPPTVQEGNINSIELSFSSAAKHRLISWKNGVNSRIYSDSESETEKALCGKLETYLIRFCLIIQVMRGICGEAGMDEIDEESAQRAIWLTEYFRAMESRITPEMETGVLDLRHTELLSLLSQSFTTSEAVATGKKLGLSESTVKRFLREGAREFIRKEAHGRYCKF